MDVIRDVTICDCTYPNLVLTVGSFDGVHLGHLEILRAVIARARSLQGTAALMSLQPHPRNHFNPEEPFSLISDPLQKEALLREAGLDVYFILPFNESIARMEAKSFLSEIIVGKCKAVHVVAGHDFRFGAGARGDFDILTAEGQALGLTTEVVPPLEIDGERVSSTRIRSLVAGGDLEHAHRLLGRPYAIAGTVVRGRGLGAPLGYPTANVVPEGTILPARGIYAAKVALDGRDYLAAVNIGIAPTLPHEAPVVEAHLLDFNGELPGRRIEVALYRHLRSEAKFDGIPALKAAIEKDIVDVRQYFLGLSH